MLIREHGYNRNGGIDNMSVLACSRKGCENIMCDRYSTQYGYICDECFEELVNSKFNIAYFMQTPKKSNYNESIRSEYEAEFEIG